jgi:hypothetical protein
MWMRSPEQTAARARGSLQAAEAFMQNAQVIAEACASARENEVVLATVAPDLRFSGARVVLLGQLREHVVYDGGWLLVFSPKCSTADVEARCAKMAKFARRRLDIIQRRTERQR